MKPAAWRLVVTAILFAGWIGYLGYLVAATRNPIVLSRPQLLVSNVVVTGKADEDRRTVTVKEVLWPATMKAELEGKTITVTDLQKCQSWARGAWVAGAVEAGHGYLLPLTGPTDGPLTFRVTPLPRSPGFDGVVREPKTGKPLDPDTLKPITDPKNDKPLLAARIYPDDEETIHQVQRLHR
jgi:hypothetical protein